MTSSTGNTSVCRPASAARSRWSWRGAVYGTVLANILLLRHVEASQLSFGSGGRPIEHLLAFLASLVLIDAALTGARSAMDYALGPMTQLAERRRRLALVATIPLALVIVTLGWPRLVTSSPNDHLLALIVGEDTTYAAGFDEGRFRAIAPGMTASDVRALVGLPLEHRAHPDGTAVASYTAGARSTNSRHWMRQVRYDTDGRVAAKQVGFQAE